MDPEFRYAKRTDGATTAYAVMGSGPLLIVPPGGLTTMEWYLRDIGAHETFCERLAERRTLILYDRHGCGLSDRDRTRFAIDDDVMDLEAVIDAVGETEFDIFGISFGGAVAIPYAAAHADSVKRMVLYGTGSGGQAAGAREMRARTRSLMPLFQTDPDLAWKTVALTFHPQGTDPDTFQSLVRGFSSAATPDMAYALNRMRVDNGPLLEGVTTPTLVLHRRGDQVAPFSSGQELARRLPNARFVPLEGDAHFPWADDAESVLRPAIEFLTEGEAVPSQMTDERITSTSGTVVIFFADIVDSTMLTEQLGDDSFREKARDLDTALRENIRNRAGVPIEGKLLGDGVLATFGSAKQAIEAALACGQAGNELGLPLHLGLHAGDVIREDNNVFGGAVNIAARVSGLSAAGEVLVSGTVRDLARTSAGVSFEDRGEQDLKGVSEPVRVFRVVRQAG